MKFCNIFNKNTKSKKKRKKKIDIFETFTKLWVSVLLTVAVLDLQLTYILAFLGSDQIAETLSITIVTEIIGVVTVYMVRAFFDSRSEGKQKLEEMKFNADNPGCPSPEGDPDPADDDENAAG